jgi:hypothetical protein
MTHNNAHNARANSEPVHKSGGANKRWWERGDANNPQKPANEEEERATTPAPQPLRRPNAPVQPAEDRAQAHDDMPPTRGSDATGRSGGQAQAPSGAAAAASKKRWWENRDNTTSAPAPAPAADHETVQPARARPGSFRPAQEQQPEVEAFAPPPPASRPAPATRRPAALNVEEAAPLQTRAPQRATRPAIPINDDDEDDAPVAPPRPQSRMGGLFGKPKVEPRIAPMDDEDDEDDAPMAPSRPAPSRPQARMGGLFGKGKPEPRVEDDEDDDLLEDDVQPRIAAKKPAGKSGGLFGRRPKAAAAAQPVDEDDDIPAGPADMPMPSRERTESKKGPRSARPNNVFARGDNFGAVATPKEHKAPVIPAGPPKIAFDTADANTKQKREVAARKRRASMRSMKGSWGKILGPVFVFGACAAMYATGFVTVSLDKGFDLKVNWPDSAKPYVAQAETTYTDKVAPGLSTAKDKAGVAAEPWIDKVSEFFAVPTPTPRANRDGFATDK